MAPSKISYTCSICSLVFRWRKCCEAQLRLCVDTYNTPKIEYFLGRKSSTHDLLCKEHPSCSLACHQAYKVYFSFQKWFWTFRAILECSLVVGEKIIMTYYTWGTKLKVLCACLASMACGSQLVHTYYKPDMGIPPLESPSSKVPDIVNTTTATTTSRKPWFLLVNELPILVF